MKSFREQLQECIESKNLTVEKCLRCGQDLNFCKKYGTLCKSGVCRVERFYGKNLLEYQGYITEVTWDAEARIYYGHVVGMRDKITFHTEKLEDVEKEFHASVDVYLECCQAMKEDPETLGDSRAVSSQKLPPVGGRTRMNQG